MQTKQETFNYDFAIISYQVTIKMYLGYTKTVWEQIYKDKYGRSKLLTKQKALSLINEHKLELVIDNEYGKIYDRKERV